MSLPPLTALKSKCKSRHSKGLQDNSKQISPLCSYLEEGQVAVPVNAGNLQIAHDDFAVLVEFLQGAVLLVQVRESAQLVLRARTNYSEREEKQNKKEKKKAGSL